MSINFHDEKNQYSYAKRDADDSWSKFIKEIVPIEGKHVLDLGCGGGIYTKQLISMGAGYVTGMDFSMESLKGAMEYCKGIENISFQQGSALLTGLSDISMDIILERAVIHHIQEIEENFKELHRVLNQNGICIIQDRTAEDCFLPGSESHIRGYFFEAFPKLKEKEQKRRHQDAEVQKALQQAGFTDCEVYHLWEVRKMYELKESLAEDLLERTGRSILHELSDEEVKELVDFILEKLKNHEGTIVEQDRWTIWVGKKG